MKIRNSSFTYGRSFFCLFPGLLCFLSLSLVALAQNPPAPSTVFVKTALGGFILGYDIDRNGTEGLLSEALVLPNGEADVAVETFDQATGKILHIVAEQKNTSNDYVTYGIFGTSVGLVEEEIVPGQFVNRRVYGTLNPLSGNKVTGRWTPPFTKNDIIISMPFSQGSPTAPVLYFDNGGSFDSFLISTNVAANTFGTPITITNPDFSFNVSPVMAYDSQTNQAVLGGSLGCFGCSTEIGLVDLATGSQTYFGGLGFGFVNGIAVDPATGTAVTATEDDFSLEFYNLATQTGFVVPLLNANNQSQSGGDVEFDPIHKLFFVSQEFSSVSPTGSSILVYDEQGNFVEAVNGLTLPASPAYIALQPSNRTGYVIVTPALNELQKFSY